MSQQPSLDELRHALRKSAVVIQEQQRALASYREPIAVIGMGCRFPGDVTSPDAFWELLRMGVSAASPRSVMQDYPGHYLGEPGWFDAAFFGIAPREAQAMDPQQHLVLEVCVEALEAANIAISDLMGSQTGVYIGVMNQDFGPLLIQQEQTNVYASTGSEASFLAGRLSYSFGLQGPSMTVGTACSSSLVTIHLACHALRNHECDLAVAGGVSLILTPTTSDVLTEMHALAPDGLSKTFDARADGYGRGEGCGLLILKRLADAERDGDTIYALIRGSAVNHDGRSGGLTVPNGLAQEALLRQALAAAQVAGHTLSYVEAHGTGTVLGDPIELRALSNVLGHGRTHPLLVGSVKTNIGHLEAAAGVAGLMKVILALRHRQVPPHLHLHEPNPHIPWQDLPLQVPTQLTAWASDELRLAGISSFGLSGVNAHIIVQEAPQRPATPGIDPRPLHLLTLSAKHPQALTDLLERYRALSRGTAEPAWGDICYTAQVGRAHYPHRLALVAASLEEAKAQIEAYLTTHDPAGLQLGQSQQPAPRVAFLFTGQGSQYAGMGLELDATEPTFREALDACATVLDPLLGRPLRAILNDPALIDQTTYTQPALFALEYALAQLWLAWGIEPAILIGHSVGELVAACLAGVFSLEDGLKLVAARGRLMGDLPPDGAMVAIATDEARVRDAIAPYIEDVAIAAVNGPTSVVISGRTDAVQAIAAQFAAHGIRTQALTVSHAFHSPLLDPMLADFRAVATGIAYHPPTRRLVSNLTGGLAGNEVATPDYWVRHVREAVRFADGVETLHAQGVTVFLEIGPKSVLLGLAEQGIGDRGSGDGHAAHATQLAAIGYRLSAIGYVPSLRPNQPAWQTLLTSLGALYVRGVALSWAGLHRNVTRRKVALPTYPFQRQRYWLDVAASRQRDVVGSWITHMTYVPQRDETICETTFSVEAIPFLAEHQVYGEVVAPGACQLVLALSAAELSLEVAGGLTLHDVILPQALVLPEGQARTVQAILSPAQDQGQAQHVLQITSFEVDRGPVATHVTGTVTSGSAPGNPGGDLTVLRQRCTTLVDLARWENMQAVAGITLGPTFRWIAEAWQGGDSAAPEVLARLTRPTAVPTLDGYPLHPGLLDACFQVAALQAPADQGALLPFALTALHWHGSAQGEVWWCHARQTGPLTWDVQLLDVAGTQVVVLDSFQMRAAPVSAIQGTSLHTDWLTTLAWQPHPLPAVSAALPAVWLLVGATDALAAELAQSAPVRRIQATADAATIRQQVDVLAAQYPSLGVVFWVEDVARGAISHDGHSERSEESRSGPFAALRVDMRDGATIEERDYDAPAAALTACTALLHLSQALIATTSAMRLWVVTSGAQAVAGYGPGADVAVGGSLWGFGRTLAREEPRLRCVLVDLDASQSVESQAHTLTTELQISADAEEQVAWRGETRFVARREPWAATPGYAPDQPQRLQLDHYGTLDALRYVPLIRRTPGPGEVAVQVQAAGLNLRDVLNSLGLLQDYYATAFGIHQAQDVGLGLECAGVVTAVGPDVTAYAVGDRVMGLVGRDGAFASEAILSVATMTHIPAGMDMAAAATVPLAFLTAWYGLVELAHLQPGERVLIHAAAGGMGQAAVQVAQAIGATVIATASPGKWALLQRQGVAQLANSRTLDFVATVQTLTDGQGVDVVLNSLSGPFIEASLAALGRGGRFVEIGKQGIWSAAEVAARRPDVAYHPFDLGEVLAADATLGPRLWQAFRTAFASGRFRPLPMTTVPAARAVRAFRTMQQAQHVGKIVLDFRTAVALDPAASYLITGGLGALGLQVAEQLVADGARHLVLSSRRDVATDAQRTVLAQLAAAGATVEVVPADMGHAAEVQALLARCTARGPLKGIVHAAGVLDDGVLMAQTPARLAGVMRPKADGAWHLHQLTAGLELDFFVSFSSLASLLGSAGQSTYAAANGFLDGLMQLRRAQGLPGLSINWGPWAEVGMAAPRAAQFQRHGVGMLAPAQGRAVFQHLLWHGKTHVAVMVTQRPVGKAAPPRSKNLLATLAALPLPERQEQLVGIIQEAVAQVVGMQMITQIDPNQPLLAFGVDSLMAVQIRKWVETALGVQLAISTVLDGSSVRSLAAIVAEQMPSEASLPAATVTQEASITNVPGAGESAYLEVEGEL